MTFTVYENRVHNYASIHRSSCGYIKDARRSEPRYTPDRPLP